MAEQLLAAHNALMGTTNILVIGVPAGWRLVEGYGPPEVDLWSEFAEHRWMRGGHAVYRLVEVHPERPDLVSQEIEVSVTTSSSAVLALGGEPVAVAGHPGAQFQGSVPKGLWPRRQVPALTVEWTCPETKRLVRIVVSGAPRERLAALLDEVLAGVRCH